MPLTKTDSHFASRANFVAETDSVFPRARSAPDVTTRIDFVDAFECLAILPAPFFFSPTTSVNSLAAHLDSSALSKNERPKELSLRLFSLLISPNFELAPLCKRNDLVELRSYLVSLRKQPSSPSLLNRLRKPAEESAKLEKAIERVSCALEQKKLYCDQLKAALSTPILDPTLIAALVTTGGRITQGQENYVWQLMCKVLTSTPEMLALLARAGLDFNQPDKEGQTQLHWAVLRGEATIVRAVLSAGANPNAFGLDGLTPLHLKSNPQVIRALIAGGADPNLKKATQGGSTPLGCHIFRASLPEVIALLDNGANPDLADNFGATPLSIARYFNLYEIEAELLRRGAV